jgi:hypothetical protein
MTISPFAGSGPARSPLNTERFPPANKLAGPPITASGRGKRALLTGPLVRGAGRPGIETVNSGGSKRQERAATMTNTLTKSDLFHFTGSETWYRHGLVRDILYTDGAQYVAEKGGAYWLLDEIAFAQKTEEVVAREPFQLWKLKVKDCRGTLTCEDGNCQAIYTKAIEFTDFPLDEIALYFTNKTILLPSEY